LPESEAQAGPPGFACSSKTDAGPGDAPGFAVAPDSHELLLTDIVMPGMQGPALAQLITAERAEIRVLLISGYSSDELPTGIPLLEKPFSSAQLLARVNEICGAAAGRGARYGAPPNTIEA
jgi:DNA-binding NtrC family response regulator